MKKKYYFSTFEKQPENLVGACYLSGYSNLFTRMCGSQWSSFNKQVASASFNLQESKTIVPSYSFLYHLNPSTAMTSNTL